MKIKSYFANTVEDAMATARQELGPDAMLMNSRKASPDTRHLGTYEVVFVTDVAEKTETSSVEARAVSPSNDRLTQQMAELKRELEGMRRTITLSALAPTVGKDISQDGSEAYQTLTAGDLSPELAREIIRATEARIARTALSSLRAVKNSGAAGFRRALVEELQSRFSVQAMLGRGEARPKIVALVGPPGCGKTTTLVKLAVNYGLAARRPVLLLSIDNYRVAAAEQLRSYATILGVGFQFVETVPALAQAIEENRGKELIFIDTPGLSVTEVPDYGRLAHFLATRSDIDTQLVVSSSMKSADLTRVVDGFEALQPRRLIFTRLDETGSFGPIVNEAARTGKAVSFFSTGQRIPEDLEAATKSRLTDLILGTTAGRAASAA